MAAPAFATRVTVVLLRSTVTGTHPSTPQRSWKSSRPPPKVSVEPAFISAKVNGREPGCRPKLPLPITGTTMESSLNCEPELLVVVMRTVTSADWPAATLYGAGTSACAAAAMEEMTAMASASGARRVFAGTELSLGRRGCIRAVYKECRGSGRPQTARGWIGVTFGVIAVGRTDLSLLRGLTGAGSCRDRCPRR